MDNKINDKLERLVKEAAKVSRDIYKVDMLPVTPKFLRWVNMYHHLFVRLRKDNFELYHKYEPDINLFYSKDVVTDNIFHFN